MGRRVKGIAQGWAGENADRIDSALHPRKSQLVPPSTYRVRKNEDTNPFLTAPHARAVTIPARGGASSLPSNTGALMGEHGHEGC